MYFKATQIYLTSWTESIYVYSVTIHWESYSHVSKGSFGCENHSQRMMCSVSVVKIIVILAYVLFLVSSHKEIHTDC